MAKMCFIRDCSAICKRTRVAHHLVRLEHCGTRLAGLLRDALSLKRKILGLDAFKAVCGENKRKRCFRAFHNN